MKRTDAAKTAAMAVAPEVAIPVEAALGLVAAARSKPRHQETEVRGDVVLVPPPDKPLLLVLKKERIRVVTRKGIRIVTVTPAKGLTAGETIVVGTVGIAAYGIYEAAKAVNKDLAAWNPSNWFSGGGNPILKKIGL